MTVFCTSKVIQLGWKHETQKEKDENETIERRKKNAEEAER